MTPITKTQQNCLDKMELGKWYSAYDLQVELNILGALKHNGLVKARVNVGGMLSPRRNIEYQKVAK